MATDTNRGRSGQSGGGDSAILPRGGGGQGEIAAAGNRAAAGSKAANPTAEN